ncbi:MULTISPECIES: chemotaxis protein CheW [Rhizobiaceae]|jgi:purine-binding chemotaxis protein CheW|uniref:Purine-binding chemotaxis protein CheW n=2 Tax=Rhizobiaceae TaxID=82115 RepID=A0A7W6Y1S3_9HYPH|nr:MULTISPECIES: chemotaxis protein CheW [Rhizobium/Agrobacterium group]MBB4349193.1 purine-binding chemotaxis protein CheW [Rhizobium cellulosilyticum]MBB4412586.1 purine-binding chemotaxis protein CheW [Rhizobium cellulosilyticum]MBB4447218.1 purine-binding chemotaxis protein CheW [Rhizobium cellulosilyticum]MBB6163287.1 purine-binding chemotaxis protein CheW [Rhizobium wenxiniae]MBO0140791.1 chemotaxis protein CheW [Agrobacterium sp. Ap1]
MNQALAKLSEDLWEGRDELEVLTFEIAGETFALEAFIVQEILDLLPETSVPGAKAFVGAVINFRGKVIPLADIRLAFGMEATKPTIDSRIIVIEIEIDGEPVLAGIRTDKVNEVTTLLQSASEPPPSVGMRWRPDFINCLVKRGSEFIIVPNLQVIFSARHERSATAPTHG